MAQLQALDPQHVRAGLPVRLPGPRRADHLSLLPLSRSDGGGQLSARRRRGRPRCWSQGADPFVATLAAAVAGAAAGIVTALDPHQAAHQQHHRRHHRHDRALQRQSAGHGQGQYRRLLTTPTVFSDDGRRPEPASASTCTTTCSPPSRSRSRCSSCAALAADLVLRAPISGSPCAPPARTRQ